MLRQVRTFGSQVRYTIGGITTSAGIACRETKRKAAAFFARFRQMQDMGATTTTVVAPSDEELSSFDPKLLSSDQEFELSDQQLYERRKVFWGIETGCSGLNSGRGLNEWERNLLTRTASAQANDENGVGWSDVEMDTWKELASQLNAVVPNMGTTAVHRKDLNAAWKRVLELKPAELTETDETSSYEV